MLAGTCDEDLALPYEPFVEALRFLVGVLPADELAVCVAEAAGELARLPIGLERRLSRVPPAQAADAATERYLLFCAVSDLLAAVSRARPVVLVLEDLQWATKPTLMMLKHLVRSTDPMALFIVATYRDSDVGRAHPLSELLADLRRESGAARLNLRGLSDGETIALMESLAGHPLEGDDLSFARAVYAETDGNPFFIRELLRSMAESGELAREGERWSYRGELTPLGIPDSLRETIGRRVSRLPQTAERLLRLAAVIGREFDAGLLAAMEELPHPDAVAALGVAARARLVEEVPGRPGRFTFVHALIRHTLYDELGPAQKMLAHRALALRLETLGTPDVHLAELAHHWRAATPAPSVDPDDVAKAVHYSTGAAGYAMSVLAYEEAVQHYSAALAIIGPAGGMGVRGDLLIGLGEAQRCAGEPAHRETLLEAGRLAQDLGDPDRATRAALANHRGFYSRYFGVDHDRVQALEAALDLVGVDGAAAAARARLLALLAGELHFVNDDRRLGLARQALSLARHHGDPATLAHVLAAVWFATWGLGDLGERAQIALELHELSIPLGDRTIEFEAAAAVFLTAFEQADLETAGAALEACTRIGHELGQPMLRWRVAYLGGNWECSRGNIVRAEELAAHSLTIAEATGIHEGYVFSQALHTLALVWEGRFDEAEPILTEICRRYPTSTSAVLWSAWVRAETGRPAEAMALIEELRSQGFANLPRDYLWHIHMAFLARTAHCLGDHPAAAALYALLFPHDGTVAVSQTICLGPVAHHLGLLAVTLGRLDDADRHFIAAGALQERFGMPVTLVHTQLEHARLLIQRAGPGDGDRARPLLAAARAGAHEFGLVGLEPVIEAPPAR